MIDSFHKRKERSRGRPPPSCWEVARNVRATLPTVFWLLSFFLPPSKTSIHSEPTPIMKPRPWSVDSLHQWATNSQDPPDGDVATAPRVPRDVHRTDATPPVRAERWSLVLGKKKKVQTTENRKRKLNRPRSRTWTTPQITGASILTMKIQIQSSQSFTFPLHIQQKRTGAKQKRISCSWKPCRKNRNQRNLTFLCSSGKQSDPKLTGNWWHI